ncbi:MAG: hypothetical protein ACQERB_04510 [Promethearchaeati archaeon]
MVGEKDKDTKNDKAKKVAEVMVANMKANMEDPDFLLKKERRMQEAANKVLKKRKEREETNKEKQ